MLSFTRRFAADESGPETVEKTTSAAMLAGGLLVVFIGLGVNMKDAFTALQTGTALRP